MRIAHRMYLTVLPALLGVVVVAALAYWGQYEHRVPYVVLVVAALAAVGTSMLAWLNARYVAQRVERLASAEGSGDATQSDELDAIESVVDRLSGAVAIAELGKSEGEQAASKRLGDYATLMSAVADDVAKRLEEVRLALHILLDNHFGELNENQEEMLGSARAAADAADADVDALQQLADLDRGARTLRRDRILPGDLLKALVPTLQAQAEKHGATLHVDMEPLVPAIWGDHAQLQAALSTLLTEAIVRAETAELDLQLRMDSACCEVIVKGGGPVPMTVRTALAMRMINAMGGHVTRHLSELRISLCQPPGL